MGERATGYGKTAAAVIKSRLLATIVVDSEIMPAENPCFGY